MELLREVVTIGGSNEKDLGMRGKAIDLVRNLDEKDLSTTPHPRMLIWSYGVDDQVVKSIPHQ